jgi:hypothetical protein
MSPLHQEVNFKTTYENCSKFPKFKDNFRVIGIISSKRPDERFRAGNEGITAEAGLLPPGETCMISSGAGNTKARKRFGLPAFGLAAGAGFGLKRTRLNA